MRTRVAATIIGNVPNMLEEAASFDELAELVLQRAARISVHSEVARRKAAEDAAGGHPEWERLHLREARAHERSAQLLEQTAALYRERASQLRAAATAQAIDH